MLLRDAEGVMRGGSDADVQSLAPEFWVLINSISTIEAGEIAHRLAPPPVGSLSFPESGDAGGS